MHGTIAMKSKTDRASLYWKLFTISENHVTKATTRLATSELLTQHTCVNLPATRLCLQRFYV